MKRRPKLAELPSAPPPTEADLVAQILRNVEGLVQLQAWQRTLTDQIRRDCERFQASVSRVPVASR